MTTRKDIHSPLNYDGSDYRFEGLVYLGQNEEASEIYLGDLDASDIIAGGKNWQNGNFSNKGTCDHCGACFTYGCVFEHEPTGEYIVIGHQCASERFSCEGEKASRAVKIAQKQVARIRENAKIKQSAKSLIESENLAEDFRVEHYIIQDIRAKLFKYGSISDRQVALVHKIASEKREYTERLTSEAKMLAPVPAGRIEIKGVVLSTKYVDSHFGATLKMLVLADAENGQSFKIWGTVPGVWEDSDGIQKGVRVHFRATVEQSRDDEKFGFFKRPHAISIDQS